jgi:hypothetical protein
MMPPSAKEEVMANHRYQPRVAALFSALFLLALALPAASGEERYLARPESLPAWAEQGAFRFIRIDGGRIESMKAERTWWGKEFSVEEKDILAHAYDTHFDRILGLLQEARFNWIWVTWSNGWSLDDEAENREQLQKVIARCHQAGIHVTAYLSASNMFWRSTFRDDPETMLYGLYMYGLPIFYAGAPRGWPEVNFQRRLADLNFPGWRKYLLRKAELALDAGADAIFYDNMIGYTPAMRLLLTETQRLAERKAADLGRPKAMVYGNIHLPPYRFELNDQGEALWMEDGKDTPGVWDGFWQVEGARKIKFLRGEKLAWQPLMYENDVHHCGPRERCIPAPEEQKLSMAEAQVFGAAYSRNLEGRFLAGLVSGKAEALAAWSAIARYNGFFAEHEDLYRRVAPVARIALLTAKEKEPVADYFIRESVIFETIVLKFLGKSEPLADFAVLVVPSAPLSFNQSQAALLRDFVARGGRILADRPEAVSRSLGIRVGAGLAGLPAGSVDRIARGLAAPELLAAVAAAAGGPALKLEQGGHLLAHLTRRSDGALIIHLLNYDLSAPATNARVTVELGAAAAGAPQVLSPDEPAPVLSGLAYDNGRLSFTLDRVERYAAAVVK